MRVKIIWLVALVVMLTVTACSRQSEDTSKPIAKVNDYTITENDMRHRLAKISYFRGTDSLTIEDKKNFLDQEIQKELLINEAIREGLDREQSFRDAIQTYWEQTLITGLIKQKMDAVDKSIIVTSEEVAAAYKKMVAADPNTPPLEKVATAIANRIRGEKKTEAVKAWTDELRKKAKVEIYEDNLAHLR